MRLVEEEGKPSLILRTKLFCIGLYLNSVETLPISWGQGVRLARQAVMVGAKDLGAPEYPSQKHKREIVFIPGCIMGYYSESSQRHSMAT